MIKPGNDSRADTFLRLQTWLQDSIGAAARSTVSFAFPLGVVPSQGYFFTFFLALQNRGSYRANNRAEYAKLVT